MRLGERIYRPFKGYEFLPIYYRKELDLFMQKQPDLPHRSEKSNGRADSRSAAQNSESEHYADWQNLTSTDQNEKLKQFFERWEVPAPDLSKCPPEAELVKPAEKWDSETSSHISTCKSCLSLVKLISDPNRVRIPVSRILADASQRAWNIEHSERRPSFTARHVESVYHSIPSPLRRVAFSMAAAVVIMILSFIAYQYNKSKTPSQVVTFDQQSNSNQVEKYAWFDKTDKILATPDLDTESKIKTLEHLQSAKPTISETNLDSAERAKSGTAVAKYNNQVNALKDSPNAKNVDTKSLSITPTENSEIVTIVWFAFGSADAPTAFNREDPKNAKTILKAAEFTEVTAIEPKADQKTIVEIKVPQNYFEPNDLKSRLESLKTQGLDVRVVAYNAPLSPRAKL